MRHQEDDAQRKASADSRIGRRIGLTGSACFFLDVIHDVNDDTEASLGDIREKLFLLWGYEPRRGLEESETNKPPAMRVRIEG